MFKEALAGHQKSSFPKSLWSSLQDGESEGKGLEKLLSLYWRPLFCSARFGWNLSTDAADQALRKFFTFLSQDPDANAQKITPFRSFLKENFRRFMLSSPDSEVETPGIPCWFLPPLPTLETFSSEPGEPEQVFDQAWLELILQRAVETLQSQFREKGKEVFFTIFQACDLSTEPKTYTTLAKEFSLTENELRNGLHQARDRFRRLVIEQIADYALDEEDALTELKWILG